MTAGFSIIFDFTPNTNDYTTPYPVYFKLAKKEFFVPMPLYYLICFSLFLMLLGWGISLYLSTSNPLIYRNKEILKLVVLLILVIIKFWVLYALLTTGHTLPYFTLFMYIAQIMIVPWAFLLGKYLAFLCESSSENSEGEVELSDIMITCAMVILFILGCTVFVIPPLSVYLLFHSEVYMVVSNPWIYLFFMNILIKSRFAVPTKASLLTSWIICLTIVIPKGKYSPDILTGS